MKLNAKVKKNFSSSDSMSDTISVQDEDKAATCTKGQKLFTPDDILDIEEAQD